MNVKFKGTSYNTTDGRLADTVAFERKFNVPASVLGEGSPRVEWLCFLAWRGLVALNAPVGAFDDNFLGELEFDTEAAPAEAAAPLAQEVPAT